MPQWYVVHAWSGSFQDLVATLVRDLDPEPQPTPGASNGPTKVGLVGWQHQQQQQQQQQQRAPIPSLEEAYQLPKDDPKAQIFIWLGRQMTRESRYVYGSMSGWRRLWFLAAQ